MKYSNHLSIILLIGTLIFSCSSDKNQQPEKTLFTLLEQKEYFRLRDQLAESENLISNTSYLFFQATVDNVFNRNEKSIALINELLQQPNTVVADSLKALLLQTQIDNYVKSFQYKKAHEAGQTAITRFTAYLDSSELAEIKNADKLWAALSNTAPQQTIKKGDTYIPIKKDKVDLLNIPVQIKQGRTENFIFDTGAGLSTIRKSLALEMGLSIIDINVAVGSSTTHTVQSQLAVADSLNIAGLLIKNVVFLVLEDDQLSFPQINYVINGIIGLPVISQWKEIHLSKDGTLKVPAVSSASVTQNLAFDGLMPVINTVIEKDTLSMQFDTGAKTSDFTHNYFNLHKTHILQTGKRDTIQIAGAGGVENRIVYQLKDLSVMIGDQQAILQHADIAINPVGKVPNRFYGRIGQDIISQFKTMVINFDRMYLSFIP